MSNLSRSSSGLVKGRGIYSVRDREGVFVIDPERQIYWRLTGLEADIWDWIALNHPFEEILQFSALYLDLSVEAAKDQVFKVFQKWLSDGILKVEET